MSNKGGGRRPLATIIDWQCYKLKDPQFIELWVSIIIIIYFYTDTKPLKTLRLVRAHNLQSTQISKEEMNK